MQNRYCYPSTLIHLEMYSEMEKDLCILLKIPVKSSVFKDSNNKLQRVIFRNNKCRVLHKHDSQYIRSNDGI